MAGNLYNVDIKVAKCLIHTNVTYINLITSHQTKYNLFFIHIMYNRRIIGLY